MFFYRLLRILLHPRVESRINLQSVRVDIIIRTILLFILRTPAIQRIRFPRKGVFIEFLHLPTTIITLHRLGCCHHTTQVFTEISSQTFLVVNTVIRQFQRKRLQRITFGFSNISRFTHLSKHHITTAARTLIKTNRIIE